MGIEKILNYAIDQGASDIHLSVGRPQTVRIHGELVSVDENILKSEDTEELLREITTEEQRKKIDEVGGIDFGFTFSERARFHKCVHIDIPRRAAPATIEINLRFRADHSDAISRGGIRRQVFTNLNAFRERIETIDMSCNLFRRQGKKVPGLCQHRDT